MRLAHGDLWLCQREKHHTLFWDSVWVGECRFGSRYGIHQGWATIFIFFFFWEKEKLEGQMPVLGAQPYFISLEQSTEAPHTYSMSSQDVTPSWFVFSFFVCPSLLIRDLLLVFNHNLMKKNALIVTALGFVLHFCFFCQSSSAELNHLYYTLAKLWLVHALLVTHLLCFLDTKSFQITQHSFIWWYLHFILIKDNVISMFGLLASDPSSPYIFLCTLCGFNIPFNIYFLLK